MQKAFEMIKWLKVSLLLQIVFHIKIIPIYNNKNNSSLNKNFCLFVKTRSSKTLGFILKESSSTSMYLQRILIWVIFSKLLAV